MSTAAFVLTDEHEELRASFAALRRDGIAPHAAVADDTSRVPVGVVRTPTATRASAGLLFPEAFGGDGGDWLTYAIARRGGRACLRASSLFVLISKLGDDAGAPRGSPELQARTVPRVASGRVPGELLPVGADAGSDVAA